MAGSGGNVSIGERPDSDGRTSRVSNEPDQPNPLSRTLGEKSDEMQSAAEINTADGSRAADSSAGAGEAPASEESPYGEEGTNKTMPHPKPDNTPSEDLGGDHPYIPKSPHTRG
jgi:hypothetical protein